MTIAAGPTLREGPRPDIGLRASARRAWRALVAALVELDSLGVRTPCDEDPVAFLGDDFDQRAQAAKRCGLCPIRSECGDFADKQRVTHGVWGGRDRTRGAGVERARRERAERLGRAGLHTPAPSTTANENIRSRSVGGEADA